MSKDTPWITRYKQEIQKGLDEREEKFHQQAKDLIDECLKVFRIIKESKNLEEKDFLVSELIKDIQEFKLKNRMYW